MANTSANAAPPTIDDLLKMFAVYDHLLFQIAHDPGFSEDPKEHLKRGSTRSRVAQNQHLKLQVQIRRTICASARRRKQHDEPHRRLLHVAMIPGVPVGVWLCFHFSAEQTEERRRFKQHLKDLRFGSPSDQTSTRATSDSLELLRTSAWGLFAFSSVTCVGAASR